MLIVRLPGELAGPRSESETAMSVLARFVIAHRRWVLARLAAAGRRRRLRRTEGHIGAELRLRPAGPARLRGESADRAAVRLRRRQRPDPAGRHRREPVGSRRHRQCRSPSPPHAAVPGARVVSYADTPALLSADGRTGVVAVYPKPVPGADAYAAALPALKSVAATATRPRRAARGRHRGGRAGHRRWGRLQRADRDPVRRHRRAGRPRPGLRIVPGRHAADRRRRLDPDHVPDRLGPDRRHRRLVHRPVPAVPDRARRGHRLRAADRHPLARGTGRRRHQRRSRRAGPDHGRTLGAVLRNHRRRQPGRTDRAARCRSCAASASPACSSRSSACSPPSPCCPHCC